MLVPCSVESVRVHVLTNQHVVLLQAEGVRRLLPIWIGPDQAYSIATRIAGITSERPLTHDLIVDMLIKIGAEITRVVVKDLVADDAGSNDDDQLSVFKEFIESLPDEPQQNS